jgi:hypothetical protein
MTPIKFIGWFGTLVFAVDHSGQVNPIAAAVSVDQAEWLAWSLGRAHGVEARKVDGLPTARYASTEGS